MASIANEEGAAAIDHTQCDRQANHHADPDGDHRQCIGRPVGDGEQHEPCARNPSRQRGMLAIAKQKLLTPGKGLGDIEVDLLRRP
jgi:hypothetical protein